MQTAFCEIVFYLNKHPPQSQITNKNEIGSLLNSFHITRGICKYWDGVGRWDRKGEIGLKTAWAEMLTMRQRQERGRRTERESEWERVRESSLTKQVERRWLPQAECHPAHIYLNKREKPLQYNPTPAHKGLHHLFNTPPNTSNTINRFLLKCTEKDSLGGTTKSRNSKPIQI